MTTHRFPLRLLMTLAASIALLTTGALGQGDPTYGGTLRVGWNYAGTTVDPHKAITHGPDSWISKLVYNTLVGLDQDLAIEPELASAWQISDDGTVYTFQLVEGVRFHNGRELTSDDVKYSLERLLDPSTGSSRRANYTDIATVEAPDAHTVVITLSQPNAIFLTQLTQAAASIVAREVVEEHGGLDVVDGGSGAFRLVGQETDGSIVIERNPDYFVDGLPYLDRVVFTTVQDNQARNTAVRTGDLDLITHVTGNFISLLRSDASVVIPEGDGSSGQFYAVLFNTRRAPFDDMKVRQAIAHALDRQTITQLALDGEGFTLAGGPIPPWHWAALDPVFDGADMEAAQRLMAESGYPNGFSFTLRVWSAQQFSVRAAQIMQQTLAPLGIDITIDQQGDWATYWAAVTGADYDATIQGFGGNIDPYDYLFETFREGGARNMMGYVNREVEDLLSQSLRVTDRDARKEIVDEIQTIVVHEAPQAYLWNQKQTEAHRADVRGFYHLPTLDLSAIITTWLDR
jgi:peptide/nickel transport system substrate-binding protein